MKRTGLGAWITGLFSTPKSTPSPVPEQPLKPYEDLRYLSLVEEVKKLISSADPAPRALKPSDTPAYLSATSRERSAQAEQLREDKWNAFERVAQALQQVPFENWKNHDGDFVCQLNGVLFTLAPEADAPWCYVVAEYGNTYGMLRSNWHRSYLYDILLNNKHLVCPS